MFATAPDGTDLDAELRRDGLRALNVDRPDRLRLVLALDGVRLTEPLGYVELSAPAHPARGACAINGACSICRRAA
jgi:hypothetical protein